jgi:aspartyl-tRNA(Asn)/glutamyl-tRNA(Gln) amidotransferase subunit C
MKVEKQIIEKLAHLSRLYFNDKDEEKMLKSLNGIIEWVDKLSELDTTGVEPLTHMSEEKNVMREDITLPALDHEKGLMNAPKRDSDYFRVPKVIE